jgi:ATP-binding cassette subfamily C protein CydCD
MGRPSIAPRDAVDPPRPRGPIDPRLLDLAPALRAHLTRSAVIAVGVAAVVVLQALAVGRYLPPLIAGDPDAALPLAACLLVGAALRAALRYATEASAAAAVDGARRSITARILDHIGALDDGSAVAAPPARVTSLVTGGIDALDPWIRSYLPTLCLAVAIPLAAGATILIADPVSAAILLVAVPLIPIFMALIGKVTEDRTARQWSALQRLAGHFHDVLVGLETLRLFGRAEAQVGRVRAIADQYRVAVMGTLRVAFLSALVLELLATMSVAVVAVSIGIRLTDGSVGLSAALVVLLLAPECSLPLRRVGAAYHAGVTGVDASAEIAELLALRTTPDGPVAVAPAGPLRLADVVVSDGDRGHRVGPVSLTVAPGELVVVAGPSGSGKSTLLDAARGRLIPSEGSISIGQTDHAVPLGDLGRSTVASLFAWAPQQPGAFGDTVSTSAALGAKAHPNRILDVEVADQLDRLDLTTRRHHHPAELSGGERARLALARALVRVRAGGARFVVVDEPTAHLDADHAAAVTAELRRAADDGIGVLVASHDPAVLDAADRVVAVGQPIGLGSDPSAAHRDADPASRRDGANVAPRVDHGPRTRLATIGMPVPEASPVGPDPAPTPADGGDARGLADLRWFRVMARPERLRLLGSRSLGAAAEACTLGLAATAAWLIVRASEQPLFAQLAVAAVAVRAFGIAKGLLRYSERLASHDATFRVLADVRGLVVDRLGHIVPAGLGGRSRGDVMARVVDDVDRLADLELRVIGPVVGSLVVGSVVAIGAVAIDATAGVAYGTAVALGALVLPAMTAVWCARTSPATATARGDLAGAVLELCENRGELIANGADRPWRAAIAGSVDQLGGLERSRSRRVGITSAAASALGPLLAATAVLAVGSRTGAGAATEARISGPLVGVLVLVPFALGELLSPLVSAGELFASVRASASRLRAILVLPDPVREPADPVPLDTGSDLVLDQAAARWPRSVDAVLDRVDLHLPAGARVAVTGPSGSGKSTIAALLVRFLEPSAGRYELGGTDSAALGGDQVRRVVTWCQQQPWLADTSLRENLRLAAPTATDDDLRHVLDQVQLGAWCRHLPQGLDTLVGRGGGAMSGGERRRLALARVLLADHRVVVLDEPSAELDQATADAVLEELVAALDDRTILVLTHDSTPDGFAHLRITDGTIEPADEDVRQPAASVGRAPGAVTPVVPRLTVAAT